MQQITIGALKALDWKPVRNKYGELIGISIGRYKNIKLKYISKKALDYILSKHPLKLSSLEMELL